MRTLCLLISGLLLFSCGSEKQLSHLKHLNESNCHQLQPYSYSYEELPTPLHELEIDSVLLQNFSFESLNVANAIDALDILKEFVVTKQAYEEEGDLQDQINLIELSQKLQTRINITSLEISAIASEIDCEEERAEQIANFMSKKEDKRDTRLTVGAIVVGATGAIVSVFLLNADQGAALDLVGVLVGVTEVALGLAILLNSKYVKFYHERNALSDIWYGREVSVFYPKSLWYYLNYYQPENADEKSPRIRIIENWMNIGELANIKPKDMDSRVELIFGKGGKYTSEQLGNRANMLDQVEAQVGLFKQELNQLAIEIEGL